MKKMPEAIEVLDRKFVPYRKFREKESFEAKTSLIPESVEQAGKKYAAFRAKIPEGEKSDIFYCFEEGALVIPFETGLLKWTDENENIRAKKIFTPLAEKLGYTRQDCDAQYNIQKFKQNVKILMNDDIYKNDVLSATKATLYSYKNNKKLKAAYTAVKEWLGKAGSDSPRSLELFLNKQIFEKTKNNGIAINNLTDEILLNRDLYNIKNMGLAVDYAEKKMVLFNAQPHCMSGLDQNTTLVSQKAIRNRIIFLEKKGYIEGNVFPRQHRNFIKISINSFMKREKNKLLRRTRQVKHAFY